MMEASPVQPGTYKITLGKSLRSSGAPESVHILKYNHRPEAVTACTSGVLQKDADGGFVAQFTSQSAGRPQKYTAGPTTISPTTEFVAIFDPITHSYVLERLDCTLDFTHQRTSKPTLTHPNGALATPPPQFQNPRPLPPPPSAPTAHPLPIPPPLPTPPALPTPQTPHRPRSRGTPTLTVRTTSSNIPTSPPTQPKPFAVFTPPPVPSSQTSPSIPMHQRSLAEDPWAPPMTVEAPEGDPMEIEDAAFDDLFDEAMAADDWSHVDAAPAVLHPPDVVATTTLTTSTPAAKLTPRRGLFAASRIQSDSSSSSDEESSDDD
ncbi:hypothetical protein SeMB42_g05493 [Synchytrium endobioticum]|uniref:Transcription elongation factor Eaf N-terminal domain-containing protein n=1 Tax=Synchytrium endobioticum TaxID=286115 RepID=A0A507CR63_9FUNG|nr:hypothetical protein SeLEV6574_g06100 [Synchytrium endobioticum]TPX41634.1 hypothetical protein SeMB42_g05493 [Synchytrium endobioticum]